MKKMKLITSMFLSLILVISMTIQPAFAADTYDGSTAITGAVVKSNAPVGGKLSLDDYYEVSTACTSYNNTATLSLKANILEMQFLLTDNNAKVIIRPRTYQTSSQNSYVAYNYFEISSDGMAWKGGKWSADKNKTIWTVNHEIEVGYWHTLVIQYEDRSASDGLQTGAYYIDGECIKSNDKSLDIYGYRNIGFGPASSEHPVLFDNIYNWYGRKGEASASNVPDINRRTPSDITLLSDGYTLSNNTLTVPYGATVADMLGSINTTDGTDDVIRVYKDSSMTSSAENSDSAKGTTVVIAAKNGTDVEQAYSYYTVEEAEADPDVLKGKSAADISLTENDGDNLSVVSAEPGNYGKLNTDSVYKVTNNISGARVSVVNSLRGNTFAKSKTGVIEFSFCLPENSSGFKTNYSNGYTSDSNVGLYGLTVNNDGIKIGSNHFYTKSIKSNTWYNMAIEISTTGTDEFNIYLNGELIFDDNGGSSTEWYGFRTFFIIPVAANGETLYLDNISHSESFTNTNQAAKISGEKMAARGGKLYALNGASATDITLGTNEALRIYNSDWTLAESLADAEIAVVATTNGRSMERAYTYYDVELSDCVIDYNITTSDDNETLDASVYSNTPASLILAHYTTEGSAKTLEGVSSIDAAVDNNGVYVATIPASALNPAYSYTLFAWSDTDNTLTPLTTDISIN